MFCWELNHSLIPYATSSGTRVAYFSYVTFVSVVSFNDVPCNILYVFTVHLSIYIEELSIHLLQNYDNIIILCYSADSKFPMNESF